MLCVDQSARRCRIGTFVIDDQAIHETSRLPVWVKDGRGPHADCERVRGQYREDVIVPGTEKKRGMTQIVGRERSGSVIRDAMIAIDGPHNSSRGGLDEVLRWYHHHSGDSSALELER